ncbi:unnamed protein product [Rangifer tarandus platyrhynchus]|uniref:Uncharacterized protein n=1 Tax=Rangifer tarandus platyrhynchus TaxID=3082113 RepID=A0ABN9A298_RANTA|nr:unnamed protein product [Rangifer tarandus platyrhynchus]
MGHPRAASSEKTRSGEPSGTRPEASAAPGPGRAGRLEVSASAFLLTVCKHQARSESPREGPAEGRPGSSEAVRPARLVAPGTIGGAAASLSAFPVGSANWSRRRRRRGGGGLLLNFLDRNRSVVAACGSPPPPAAVISAGNLVVVATVFPLTLASSSVDTPVVWGCFCELSQTLVICPYSVRTVGSTNRQVCVGLEEAQSLANGQGPDRAVGALRAVSGPLPTWRGEQDGELRADPGAAGEGGWNPRPDSAPPPERSPAPRLRAHKMDQATVRRAGCKYLKSLSRAGDKVVRDALHTGSVEWQMSDELDARVDTGKIRKFV